MELGDRRAMVVLMADDDGDDRDITRDALARVSPDSQTCFVSDGRELLDYLRGEGDYAESTSATVSPDLILLDLNMPRMSGSEALAELKADTALKSIPIVVFSTSSRPDDVSKCYRLGANSYITKPSGFRELVETMGAFHSYWSEVVDLPHGQ
ncbi:MAG TPA: response regulator [Acidimicrobiales bacterium]|nr:response regulator [Acidimicrobiales bacterium]